MKYLMEHEMAFDAQQLGFPSIQGCHAIVLQTNTGLYGYHVAGGSGDNLWERNARLFAQFVNGHGGNANTASRLYGASFVGNNQRGYQVPHFQVNEYRRKWKAELVTFASALRYSGTISGYDLHKSFAAGNVSAYVRFTANGDKCDLQVRQWAHGDASPRVANLNTLAHMVKSGGSIENQGLINLANVVNQVNVAGLVQVHKEKLR